ncbi:MAG TPA: anthranilate synthase component I family protein [Candidatus Obscuribacterales bacterium]
MVNKQQKSSDSSLSSDETTKSSRPDGASKPYAICFSADFGTPLSLFHRLSAASENAFLFESTEGDGRLARYSLLGVDPLITVTFQEEAAEVQDLLAGDTRRMRYQNPVAMLRQLIHDHPVPSHPLLEDCPFAGGLVGYMGYGATTFLERIPRQKADPAGVPMGHYGLYDSVVVFDHQYRRVTFFSARGKEHVDSIVARALRPEVLPPLRLTRAEMSEEELFEDVEGPFTRASFMAAVERAREYICEGQVFQIVVAQRFSMRCFSDPIDVYRALTAINPSPYAYFLKCPGFAYVGSSPETFVRSSCRDVFLRAIAGTRPRCTDTAADMEMEKELKSSEKEMAEHRMLVDLGRNDLGRICRPGTVKTGEIACLTRYTHVMHLATEISGDLAQGKDCFDAFQSCFPAGTVSGAPKVRAMQLLSELEPEQRGIYSGAIGYFDCRGNMDGAIAIRSALIKDGMAHVNAGAGIVYDSDPAMEYAETRNKAKSVLQAVKIANQHLEGA